MIKTCLFGDCEDNTSTFFTLFGQFPESWLVPLQLGTLQQQCFFATSTPSFALDLLGWSTFYFFISWV